MNAKGNPDGSLSHYPSRLFPPAAAGGTPRTPAPGGDGARRAGTSAVGRESGRRPSATTGAALTGAPPKRSRDSHRQDEAPPPPSPRFNTGAAARDASQASPASLARRRARPSGGRDAGDSIARRLGGASARPPHQKNQTGRRVGSRRATTSDA